MPTIVEKQEVLNGRGQVIRYGSGTSAGSYFYKEKIPGERRYKTRRIPGATTIEEAIQAAVEIAFKLQEEQPEGVSNLLRSTRKSLEEASISLHKAYNSACRYSCSESMEKAHQGQSSANR